MSYLVLARKWRPQTFDQVVGQSTVTRTLKNALASGRVGHAFLLSGARGVGKTTTARILARALNCAKGEAPVPEPCGECPSCLEIAAGASLDVQEIDGATHNGVEQVRELRESARYNPARDRFKIWIIDEVHMLSTGAFNALLKTLEEPPPRVKFIFATTEYHKIPDTILSRCQQHDFRLIPAREIQAHLRQVADGEKVRVSDEALARIARAAEGSARDALSLFDQVLSFSGEEVRDEDISALLGLIDRELLLAASRGVAEGDSLAVLELVERLSDYGADYRNYARELLLHFRELLLLKLAPAASTLLAQVLPEERERIRPLVEAYSEEDLLRAIDVLTKLDTDMRWAQDPRVSLELALLKLVQVRRLVPLAELVDRIEQLSGGAAATSTTAEPAERGSRQIRLQAPSAGSAPPGPRPAVSPGASSAAVAPSPPASAAPVAASPGASTAAVAAVAPEPSGLAAAMAALARPSLAAPLRSAQAREEGDTVVVEVAPDLLAFAEMNRDEYRDLARQVCGRPVKLQVRAAESALSPGPAEQERQRVVEAASREPAVQEALDLFGGKVLDVREAGPARTGGIEA